MSDDESKAEIKQLATKYFIDELGLSPDGVSDASNNLIAAFNALLHIDERLNKSTTP